MNELKSHRDTDLDRLSRLKALSWLSTSELSLLVGALVLANFKRREVILREAALASEVNILLTGIARITCMNARSERVTVALLAPGGDIVALVKPQFEAGRDEVGKRGLVTDPAVHASVIARVTAEAEASRLVRMAMTPSPITGATGNQEFCLHLKVR